MSRHWKPEPRIYIRPFTISRTLTVRLLPPGLAGGINGSTSAHSSSVRSWVLRKTLRACRRRVSWVHIGHLANRCQVSSHGRFEPVNPPDQAILKTQLVPGRTLTAHGDPLEPFQSADQLLDPAAQLVQVPRHGSVPGFAV